jgi:hypothetical protein
MKQVMKQGLPNEGLDKNLINVINASMSVGSLH